MKLDLDAIERRLRAATHEAAALDSFNDVAPLLAEVRRLRAIVETVADADDGDTIGSFKVDVEPYDVEGRTYKRRYLGDAARKALGR